MTLLCAIDGTTDTPEVRFHANPACGLYHWLRAASTRGQQSEGDGFAQAFDLVRQSFEAARRARHGRAMGIGNCEV